MLNVLQKWICRLDKENISKHVAKTTPAFHSFCKLLEITCVTFKERVQVAFTEGIVSKIRKKENLVLT